ncbi:MAG TPA: FAD binding domain-containing protein [Syntrophorhabdales bacterium]|nr:FAD binding domain-containing protein [Syntrophorhabdales bacterium]
MYYYRRLPPFEYVAPKSMEEAASFLGNHHADTRVSAGGTMVIHRMKERIGVRKYLMSLKEIPGLDDIKTGSAQLRLGAMALLQAVAKTTSVKKGCGMLALACAKLGTPQIRAMGTLGGNLASHLATAETVPVLIALDGQAVLVNAAGNRMVPVENLYNEIKEGEFLSEILVPIVKGQTWGYEKFAVRERFDYATVSAAVTIVMTGNVCKDVRIGLGGVTLPTRRAGTAEDLLKGRAVTDKLIGEAASAAAEGARTGGDIYFSAEYKKELVGVMVKRALTKASAKRRTV